MNREKLQALINEFSDKSPLNFLGAEQGGPDSNNYAKNNVYRPDLKDEFMAGGMGGLAGMRFFERPIFSIGSAGDPHFADIKRPEVVGGHHLMPEDWLPAAKTVISFYLPICKATVEANKKDPSEPAMEWMLTRYDGQKFLLALGAAVRDAFVADGHRAVTPYTEDKFVMQPGKTALPGTEHVPPFSTNWSERHVGYVTGLGTFGLSTNFITKKGSAGRLISVVTDWETEPDGKDYEDWLGYCNRCGACIKKCPAQAHFKDRVGKDHSICGAYIGRTCAKYSPRYGCGKCQTGTPCEYRPMKPEKK